MALRSLAVAVPVVVVAVVALAFWPSLTLIACLVGAILALARRHPRAALIAAIGLFLTEGTVKILLAHSGLAFDAAASVGAALLDVALFGSALAVLIRKRPSGVRGTWGRLTVPERFVVGAAVAWLLLSAVQAVASPSFGEALSGFRLTHAYIAIALACAVAFWDAAWRDALVTALVWVLTAVLAYACFRGLVGPADVEYNFAYARGGVVSYGGSFRTIGTFSGAVGLTTIAAPAAVFGAVLAVVSPRHRWPALALAIAGIGAQIASLGRTPLVATVVGLAFAALLLLVMTGSRRRLVGAGIVFAACLALLAGGAAVASLSSDALSERLEGLARPASDESLQLRFDTWQEHAEDAARNPLGKGLGTVGRATEGGSQGTVTTDNSYLKVFLEQGFPGLVLFLAAFFGAVALVARRLMQTPDPARAVGLAALAGFVTFAVMMTTSEALEQPGKVVAWALLGLAVAAGWSRYDSDTHPVGPSLRGLALWSRRLRPVWLIPGALLICAVVAPSFARDSTFTAQAPVSVRGGPVAPGTDPAPYLSELLADPTFQYEAPRRAVTVQFPNSLHELSVVGGPQPGSGLLRATSPTPERASRLLAAAAVELREASRRNLRARLDAELRASEDPRERAELRAALRSTPWPVRVGPLPPQPEPRRAMDRFADALPGPFPQRPDPLTLAVVLAALLLLPWLALLAYRVLRWPSSDSRPGSTASA